MQVERSHLGLRRKTFDLLDAVAFEVEDFKTGVRLKVGNALEALVVQVEAVVELRCGVVRLEVGLYELLEEGLRDLGLVVLVRLGYFHFETYLNNDRVQLY